jgi:hypothetical protein
MEIYLGFDPGGVDRFGWAVCSPSGPILRVLARGKAGNAKEAITQAISIVPEGGSVVGAGIDAPLFWTDHGGRDVDNLLRQAIKKLGAPSPGGTVQNINSLRGACLVQGVLTASLLHKKYPGITITESHPKALLYLLGIAGAQRDADAVTMADLTRHFASDTDSVAQHERDALLGAFTAFAGRERRQAWKNLFDEEKETVIPFDYPVAYWMPWDRVE